MLYDILASPTRTVAPSGMEPHVRHPRVDGATATNGKCNDDALLPLPGSLDCYRGPREAGRTELVSTGPIAFTSRSALDMGMDSLGREGAFAFTQLPKALALLLAP